MKKAKHILYVCIAILVIILLVLICTWLYGKLAKDTSFYSNLGTVSSSLSAIGGLLVFLVTFLYFLETRKMTRATQRQTELMEQPAVSIKVIPSDDTPNILLMVIKNTGGGPAYDLSVTFTPDIPYGQKTLNQLNIFNKMPLLDKGEEVKFFFGSAIDYGKNDEPKELTANLKYYSIPQLNGEVSEPIEREFVIDVIERHDLRYISRRNIHDLVNEVEELKHALVIATLEKKDGQ